jgi:hypothetical protein
VMPQRSDGQFYCRWPQWSQPALCCTPQGFIGKTLGPSACLASCGTHVMRCSPFPVAVCVPRRHPWSSLSDRRVSCRMHDHPPHPPHRRTVSRLESRCWLWMVAVTSESISLSPSTGNGCH